jgi:DNA-binding IclR family transcriptional regulator
MFDVLALVTRDRPTIEVDEICHLLNYAPASAYRYVKELAEAGFLVRLPEGYALGPRIIELDLQMRESDPLLNNSRDLMEHLAETTGLNVLLSELYGETVITTHQEYGLDGRQLNFGRGRPMALFRSATATIILAHLLPRQLRRIHDAHAGSPDLMQLGENWKEFSRAMLQLRKRGYSTSRGQLDPDKTGMAAPIFDEKQRILGSITLVGNTERVDAFNEQYLARLVMGAAAEISRRIAARQGTNAANPEVQALPAPDAEAMA